MQKLKFDYSKAMGFISETEIMNLDSFVTAAHNMIHKKSGPGNDFLGWVDLPTAYDREEFSRIKAAAQKIKSDSDALVVIGIGGSYLGARAAIEMLSHSFYNMLPKSKRKTPQIYFAGNNISSTYLADLLDLLEDKDISVNVISKSGTTTEPAVAFRIFKEYMEQKYGKEGARERIYATTDKSRGALKKLAQEEGYETFVIPDDVGGRYSVLTAVGLLPIAVSGADIDRIMEGAADASRLYSSPSLADNDCYKYAAVRNVLYRKGKTTEIMVNYEPALHYFTECHRQCPLSRISE
jgi:glucose-6-phosphate isomerase